jgi:CRISPR/Cas system-associated exonuclease Cas4 (RecB family)
MTLENTEKLIDEMMAKRKAHLAAKIQAYPASNFRASDIGECDRAMVYSVLDWNKKSLHDEGLQAIFDAGNKEEENVKARLGYDLGFKFIEQQRPFEIKSRSGEVMCRGHIDGKVLYNGEAIPIEIKSMDGNIFNSIKSLDDFHKKPLHRKYLRQMQLYLFGNGEEAGIFILSNFRTEKLIPVVLDFGECEAILQRIERNWEYVKKKEYPERMEYNAAICGKCAFKHICLQEVKNEGAKFIDNPELEARLERRAEVETYADEYAALDKEIKETFKGIPEAYVGKAWQVVGKERVSVGVDTKAIPDEIKKQYPKVTKKWVTEIVKL